jgi:hypothetical protein
MPFTAIFAAGAVLEPIRTIKARNPKARQPNELELPVPTRLEPKPSTDMTNPTAFPNELPTRIIAKAPTPETLGVILPS